MKKLKAKIVCPYCHSRMVNTIEPKKMGDVVRKCGHCKAFARLEIKMAGPLGQLEVLSISWTNTKG